MKNIYILIIVVIVAAAGVWYFTTESSENTNTALTTDVNTQSNQTQGESEISESVQDTSGGEVSTVILAPVETGSKATIATAKLTEPGYVVIYQVDSNGESEIIGNTELLAEGTYSDIEVDLDAIVALEQTIVAVLHEDDGDGVFEFPNDDLYLSTETQVIVTDVDVVDVDYEDEDESLNAQVETYLENNQ